MKKHNPYAVATLSLCISSIPLVAHSDDGAQIVDEVIVSSSYVRSTQIEKHSLVIDGESVTQGASQSLGETLDDYVGIASSDYGAAVGHPVIRGLSGNRVKILAKTSTLKLETSCTGLLQDISCCFLVCFAAWRIAAVEHP